MAKHDKVLNYHFGQLGMSKLKINNYQTKKGRTVTSVMQRWNMK